MPDRPTTKDLAKAAGVSLATVDRVLNARSGVRKVTVEAVHLAIKQIGFERNQLAATLARQKGYTFAFVLPRDGDQFLNEIICNIQEINSAFRSQMITAVALRVDETDPHKTAAFLDGLDLRNYDGVAIMAPETPQLRDAIRRVKERGVHAIPFIANQSSGTHEGFVGIDNRAAGATVASLMGRFCGTKKGSVLVVTETMQSRDSLERRLGFDHVINELFPNLKVLPSLETYGDLDRTAKIVQNALRSNHDLIGYYVMSSEARVPVEAISEQGSARGLIKIAHERTPFTAAALQKNHLDAVVTQNPGHLVRSAMRTLRAKCENRDTLASQEKIRIEILMRENL